MNADRRLPRIIAIDGPAAAGKSSVGAALAGRFGYSVLDTGMTYRALTYVALARGVPPSDAAGCVRLAKSVRMEFRDSRLLVDGVDVSDQLRSPDVEANVSLYSAIPGVRTVLVGVQRRFVESGCAIVVGRDIGTVVFPAADLKIFLDATPTARARRRRVQARSWGNEQQLEAARSDIERRDRIDSTREASPLRAAEDAIVIDTTGLSLAEVIGRATEVVERWGE